MYRQYIKLKLLVLSIVIAMLCLDVNVVYLDSIGKVSKVAKGNVTDYILRVSGSRALCNAVRIINPAKLSHQQLVRRAPGYEPHQFQIILSRQYPYSQ